MTKRPMSGIDVLDSVSKSMSEMSLSSKREAAAAQGLPMLNIWGTDSEPDIAKRRGWNCKVRGWARAQLEPKVYGETVRKKPSGTAGHKTHARSADRSRRGRQITTRRRGRQSYFLTSDCRSNARKPNCPLGAEAAHAERDTPRKGQLRGGGPESTGCRCRYAASRAASSPRH